ncbi:MAG: glycosyl hydrolase, partial [Bacteroidota bacterium]|nr:glycosyl hydrolase [Bacteroidota bacterium]
SVEYYSTIFTAIESPYEKDLLWTGSDDGLLHVSKDAGKNWEDVTPKDVPKWMMWNSIDADPFKKGAAYIVGTRYKSDDFTPYIYKTEDYGKSWKLITNGIDKMHFARVVRADKKRAGLLYTGTEYGMYISFDDGANWKKFQLNLPIVLVTDLTIKENDLIVATQGRAFYVLDDLSVLQQMNKNIFEKDLYVFDVNPAWRMSSNPFNVSFGTLRNVGTNPPAGVVFNYYVKEMDDSTKASVIIMDKNKKLVKTFSTDSTNSAKRTLEKLDAVQGVNQFVWNMLYPEGERIEGMILWNGVPGSFTAPPGDYFARFKMGTDSVEVPFIIKADPNYKISQTDYDAQYNFLTQVKDKFNEVQLAIKNIRMVRTQINDFVARQGKDIPKDVKQKADTINKQMTLIEETLYQTKAKSGQDVLNYPIKLNDKLSGVYDAAVSGNMSPSKQVRDVFADLSAQTDKELLKLKKIMNEDVAAFNELIRQKALPVIGVKKE